MGVKLLLIISLIITLGSSEDQPDGNLVFQPNVKESAEWMTGTGSRDRRDVPVEESVAEQEEKGQKYVGPYTYPKQALQQKIIRQLFSHLNKDRMKDFVTGFSKFYTRNMNTRGEDEADTWLTKEIKGILTDYKDYHYVRNINSPGTGNMAYKQANIIARLEGHDPALNDKIVILGAHYDTSGSGNQPGADDNASGCAVLMELLRITVQFRMKFNYSVEFHFYTANEGQKGSSDVVSKYKAEGKTQIRGLLNLDTIGYQSEAGGNIGFVDSFVMKGESVASPALTFYVRMLISEYLEYKMMEVACSGTERCASDHVAWHKEKHPWAFVTEAVPSPNVNTKMDTVDTVNFEQVNEFAKLALAFVIELGGLTEVPVIPIVTTTTTAPTSFGLKPETGLIGVGISFICVCLVNNMVLVD